ncbi:hypothetical protein [Pseudoalteromonas phenolica]|uniref:hypothetical protein n=1 Tax=Pseudoalteromonas phenolica TaxID=161398 RepID=UPI00110A902E|nr:hypothetical protein [Pseudoalteromonas phenolica]TMO55798.1 hypothetical protein CWC21_10155 [Pseudoalteromonas phenolica]
MKLSNKEKLFLKELLINKESINSIEDVLQEPSNQLLCELSNDAQLLLVARISNREVCFPIIEPGEVNQFTLLHYAFPHVVDIDDIHRHWRIKPLKETYLESPDTHWPIRSLSLSGALVPWSTNWHTSELERLKTQPLFICSPQSERIPIAVHTLIQREPNNLIVVFDAPTTQNLALKEFLLKHIFKNDVLCKK